MSDPLVTQVYPYAVGYSAEAAGGRLDVRGLGGAPVGWIDAGEIGAWASQIVPAALAVVTREDLLTFHRVVVAAANLGTVLPVRFGASFPEGAALAAALARRRHEIDAVLQRVQGKRELAVSLVWVAPAAETEQDVADGAWERSGAAGPGTEYLRRRGRRWRGEQARRDRAEALAQQVIALITSFGVPPDAVQMQVCPAPRLALSCSVLVETASAAAMGDAVRAAAQPWRDVVAHVQGPWPPYSFSAGNGRAALAQLLALPAAQRTAGTIGASGHSLASAGNTTDAAPGVDER